MKTIVPRSPGSWGGYSGKGWDDGVFSTIKQVRVHMNLHISAISGIQIEYEKKDKTSFRTQLHAGDSACNFPLLTLSFEVRIRYSFFYFFVRNLLIESVIRFGMTPTM